LHQQNSPVLNWVDPHNGRKTVVAVVVGLLFKMSILLFGHIMTQSTQVCRTFVTSVKTVFFTGTEIPHNYALIQVPALKLLVFVAD